VFIRVFSWRIIGMVSDEKGKVSFIKQIVDQLFVIRKFGMRCIGGMRYCADFKMPHINDLGKKK